MEIKLTKRHIIFGLVIVLICIPLAFNYSGFCFEKGRYLTNTEKFRAVFEEVNQYGKPSMFFSEGNDDGKLISMLPFGNNRKLIEVKYISYKNFEEFLRLNPNCCDVG
ncbi:hypothetical protein Syn7502_01892 [Synechococcus sp. PCC 7502]|uniref:hypothetical protein n=1 Tax=Synechococcus sp. PCC 7502 TaxID=1173263 RepID=UPI00029F9982|nr:hypothetical protein [Synechococcus sp. PCC 7502]AFY73925.1 hypothetical protein Syn7502_01892 [Synechococcus sp. PCC 7502]